MKNKKTELNIKDSLFKGERKGEEKNGSLQGEEKREEIDTAAVY